MIKFDHIDFKIGAKALLKGVGGTFEEGKIHTILGPNGAGKSTLLKLLVGLLSADQGTIQLHDRPLEDWPLNELAQTRALLEQKSPGTIPFRVEEIVAMGRHPYGHTESALDRKMCVAEIARKVQLEPFLDRRWHQLSGGEQQRVQFARCLAQLWTPRGYRGKYLFLDEPLNDLDIAFQHQLLRLGREFVQQGGTIVAVMHDLNLSARWADTCYLMQNGRTVIQGLPEKVLVPEWIEPVYEVRCLEVPRMDGSHVLEFSSLDLVPSTANDYGSPKA